MIFFFTMYHFRPEFWVKKHEESYPRPWMTSNTDYGNFEDLQERKRWKKGRFSKKDLTTAPYYTSNSEYGEGAQPYQWQEYPWLSGQDNQQTTPVWHKSNWKPHPGVRLPPLGEERPPAPRPDVSWLWRRPRVGKQEKFFDFHYRVPWKPSHLVNR